MEEPVSAGPGQLLAAARQRMKLSRADIAKRLFLSEKFIQAIEDDVADQGTNTMFVRGYIRAYAKLVEVPLDEVMLYTTASAAPKASPVTAPLVPSVPKASESPASVEALSASAPETGSPAWAYFQSIYSNFPAFKSDPRFIMGGASVFGVLALVSVLYLFQGGESKGAALLETQAAVTQDEHASATAQDPNEAVDAVAESEAPASESTATEGAPADHASVVSAALSARVKPAGVLMFSATDKSWVTALDKHGERIFAKMVQRGESFELEGESPFKIILGNPQGIRLAYNGESVKLSNINKSNVVLTLGNNAKDMNVAYLDEESNELKPAKEKKDKRSR